MTAIEKIECKLKKYPNARYSVERDTITVEATDSNGFSVWLSDNKPRYTVGYDGWHDEFDNEDEALSAFAFGLSEDCRLKVVWRGDTECAWIVEGRDETGQWISDSTTSLLFTAFWRKKTTTYRQNRLIKSEQDIAGVDNGLPILNRITQ
jgi:hypothetical protein